MKILKHSLPVDDQWHDLDIGGGVIHVQHQETGSVSLWFIQYKEDDTPRIRSFRVYGTGHEIEEPAIPVGSTIDPLLGLVWHVMYR